MVNRAREEVEECLQNDDLPRLHWVDNFAKYYASNSMFPNRELFKHCLWTAHGFKQLPLHFDLSWKNGADGESMAALPNIDELFTEVFLGNLTLDLNLLSCPFYDESFAVVRDVRRIPLKLVNTADPVEQAHLDNSWDGLMAFVPVEIHGENITTVDGLVTVFSYLQTMEGFGSATHRRWGQYSLLHVDVKIFWQLFRLLYSYPAFAGIRHDLFLIFGFWHAYHYAHVALWDEFRSTYLAAAFWSLYPSEKIMRRPKHSQSSTFFMWLRLAYPSFRDKLKAARLTIQTEFLKWQLFFVREVRSGKGLPLMFIY